MENDHVNKIVFIADYVEKAQLLKGAMTMEDCRIFLKSCTQLINSFKNDDTPTKEDLIAFNFLENTLKLHQSKGTFTLEASVLLLEALEFIAKKLQS